MHLPNQLHFVWLDFVVDLLDSDLSRSNVSAFGSEVNHSIQRKLSYVAVLHAGRHEWHRNVSLYSANLEKEVGYV